jgi:D-glycero-D-manno-heptose 1,7-bisphosphate phosphatase
MGDPDQMELLPGVREALEGMQRMGFRLFLITNQSGVGRGMYTMREVEACHERLAELLGLGPDVFTEICAATELPTDPLVYRKPSPRFLLEMIAKYGLSKASCWMVGDRLSDLQAGLNAGIASAFVHPVRDDLEPAEIDFIRKANIPVFKDVLGFVQHLKDSGMKKS